MKIKKLKGSYISTNGSVILSYPLMEKVNEIIDRLNEEEPKSDKLQRLLEWVERYSVYKNKRWLCPDNIMIKDLTAKIKELMDEE